ncbi:hypothetical protein HK104_006460 [Borealophlyctis nickersoniae]|nr:hypothetical protein HK104_006460 [Borealophlyctis nickersoniae]
MSHTQKIDATEILPSFLYLGSASAAKSLVGLKALGITHIVNLAGKAHHPSDFQYLACHFPDRKDEVDILPHIDTIFTFLDAAAAVGEGNARILLHCSGGISRSPAVAIAYVMYHTKISLKDACCFVKQRRKGIKPNVGFLRQLVELEKKLYGSASYDENDLADVNGLYKTWGSGG